MKIDIVDFDCGEALYINGLKIAEASRFSAVEIIKYLVDFDPKVITGLSTLYIDSKEILPESFPDSLDELKKDFPKAESYNYEPNS